MFERYAIYCSFDGELARRGASWLGHDLATGAGCAHPSLPGVDLDAACRRPRLYGFHATIKAPFRLALGMEVAALQSAFAEFCKTRKVAEADGLQLTQIGRFLALTLQGDQAPVKALAADVVRTFDSFRAPLTAQEIAGRNPARLNEAQRSHLMRWGYPHVMEAFQFHATLTGPLKDTIRPSVAAAAEAYFSTHLPRPFRIDALSLVGQNAAGTFKEISTLPLSA